MIEPALYRCSSRMTIMPWTPLRITSSDGGEGETLALFHVGAEGEPTHERPHASVLGIVGPLVPLGTAPCRHLGLDKFGRLFGLKDDDGVSSDAKRVAEQFAAKMPVAPPLLCDRYIPVRNLAGLVAVAIRAPQCVPYRELI